MELFRKIKQFLRSQQEKINIFSFQPETLSRMKSSIKDLQSEFERELTLRDSVIFGLKRDKSELFSQVGTLTSKLHLIQRGQVKSELSRARSNIQIKKLSEQREGFQKENGFLKAENDKMRAEIREQAIVLKDALMQIFQLQESLSKEKLGNQQTVEGLFQKAEDLKKLTAEQESKWQNEKSELLKSNQELREIFEKSEKQLQDKMRILRGTNIKKNADLKKQLAAYEDAIKQVSSLEQSLNEQKVKTKEAEASVEQKTQEVEELRASLEEIRGLRAEQENQWESERSALLKVNQQWSEYLEKSAKRFEEELNSEKQVSEELQGHIGFLTNKNKYTLAQLEEKSAAYEEAMNKVSYLQQCLEQNHASVEWLEHVNLQQRQMYEGLEAETEKFKEDLASEQNKTGQLHYQLKFLNTVHKTKMGDFQNETEKLKAALDGSQKLRDEQQKQWETERAALSERLEQSSVRSQQESMLRQKAEQSVCDLTETLQIKEEKFNAFAEFVLERVSHLQTVEESKRNRLFKRKSSVSPVASLRASITLYLSPEP